VTVLVDVSGDDISVIRLDRRNGLSIGGWRGGIGGMLVFFFLDAAAGMINKWNDNWSIGSTICLFDVLQMSK
jgi:hypothetical protein